MIRIRTVAALLLLGVLTLTGSASLAAASDDNVRIAQDLELFFDGVCDGATLAAPIGEERSGTSAGQRPGAAVLGADSTPDIGRAFRETVSVHGAYGSARLHLKLRVLII